ncbi:glycosyltransferase [Ancylobacter oerskovii]|uniref:Glycosyltransferase n=1 Tax=Ancylobacter oerskovii TaxID=459519 RepID=A0ABW4Z4G7_9HYPH|nr:glycosyltransferase [Ancylobacter oerskovii]MBS7543037.1 hypothetical protein [Ancylobacter oerskovii]
MANGKALDESPRGPANCRHCRNVFPDISMTPKSTPLWRKADVLIGSGHVTDAKMLLISELSKSLNYTNNSDRVRSLRSLSKIYIMESNLNEAEKLLGEALDLSRSNIKICIDLYKISIKKGNIENAKHYLYQAVNNKKESANKSDKILAYQLLSELMKFDDIEEAERLLIESRNIYAFNLKTEHAIVQILLKKGNIKEAESILHDIIRYTNDTVAVIKLAELYKVIHGVHEYYNILNNAWISGNKDFRIRLRLAALLYANGDKSNTEVFVTDEMLSLDGNFIAALRLAELKIDQKEYEQVVFILNKIRNLFSRDVSGALRLEKLFNLIGDIESAISVIRKALDLYPDNVMLLISLGRRLTAARRPEAVDILQKAVDLSPSSSGAWIDLSRAAASFISTERAVQYLRRSIQINGDSPRLIAELGVVLFKSGRVKEADEISVSAIERMPDNSEIVDLRLRILIFLGKFDEFEELLIKINASDEKSYKRRRRFSANLLKAKWKIAQAINLYENRKLFEFNSQDYKHLADLYTMNLDVRRARECLYSSKALNKFKGVKNISQSLIGEIINDYWTNNEALMDGKSNSEADDISEWMKIVSEHPGHTGCAAAFMIALRRTGKFNRTVSSYENNKIPKIIFQFWDVDEIPDDVRYLMNTWKDKNSEWEYKLFSLSEASAFIQQKCDRRVFQAFRRMESIAGKSDVFRLAVLLEIGGVYADADDACLAPIDALIAGHELVLRQEHYGTIGNNFIATIPNNEIIQKLLNNIVESSQRGDRESIWLRSGPGQITRTVSNYLSKTKENIDKLGNEIFIADQHELHEFCACGCRAAYKHTSMNWQNTEFMKR